VVNTDLDLLKNTLSIRNSCNSNNDDFEEMTERKCCNSNNDDFEEMTEGK
jgi:hypothetical protein